MTYLKMLTGNESLNTKQYPVSPECIPLCKGDGGRGSIFQINRGVSFFPQKREVIMIVA